MNNSYIVEAVSERVSNDLCAINPITYDMRDDLDNLIIDLTIPLFFQYCVNKGFIIDDTSAVVQCLKYFVDYITSLMLDELVPDYDPEEGLS